MKGEGKEGLLFRFVERTGFLKEVFEHLGIKFKLIFVYTIIFILIFILFAYLALRFEERNLLRATDELCRTISRQLAYSTAEAISTTRVDDYVKKTVILHDYLVRLQKQYVRGLKQAGIIDLTGKISGKKYSYAAHFNREYEGRWITGTRLAQLNRIDFSGHLEEPVREGAKWVPVIVYFMPYEVYDKKLGAIEITFSREEILSPIREARFWLSWLSVGLILLSVPVVYMVGTRMSRPLIYLTGKTTEASRGDLDIKINKLTHDEIGTLSVNFSKMLRSIRRQQNELLEKERMERELKIAQEIQQSLLPSSVPDFPGCTFASYFQPHSEASGDYFDFIPIDGENIGIVIADVSGHGVGASLVMVMTRTILRSMARKETNPVKVMKLMNPSIYEDTLSTMFVTMFYGVLNARKKVLSYATAGHNRGMLYNRKERRITMLKPGGVPLGAVVSETFDEHVKGYQLTLSPGDIFLQYTDGVVEARNPRGDEFGDENLLEAVKNSAAKSSRELVDAVMKSLKSFVGNAKSHDDITLIAFSMD